MSTDTSIEAHKKQREIIFSKTVSERFMMGMDMSDFGIQLVIDNLKKNSSREPLKIQLIKRLYGKDFSPEEMEQIVNHFKNR